MKQTAYAKLNLALHVRAKRNDGFHEIETLFAFVDSGDELVAESAAEDRVIVSGEFAGEVGDPFDNLVARALNALPRPGGLSVTLDKRLPVAAGLGGGSADAGAIFRIVRETHGLPDDWRARAARLGADVPACVDSALVVGRGTGTELEPAHNDLSGMAVLVVNPRVPLATAEVYGAWDRVDRGPLPHGPASRILGDGRNDLELPAMRLCPFVADVLFALDATRPALVRMAGSGASCFALYSSEAARDAAEAEIAAEYPGWWQLSGTLR